MARGIFFSIRPLAPVEAFGKFAGNLTDQGFDGLFFILDLRVHHGVPCHLSLVICLIVMPR
jgi:hypothetical protein